MIFLYRLLFLPLLVVALPRYLGRMFRRGGYMRMMRGRLGLGRWLPAPPKGVRRVWVQAVSVGEFQAVAPVIEELCRRGDRQVVLTVTTSTAYALALEKFSGVCLDIRPFPLDFWACSAAAWRRIRPDISILMEGELWPEHLRQAQVRGVPVMLVNARMSDRSWRRFRRFEFPARRLVLERLTRILAGNEQDARRFELLGAENVSYAGQLKCDAPVAPLLDAGAKKALREELFPALPEGALVVLGSSTWPGEEAFLVRALLQLRVGGLDVRLLLVPRHAERRTEVAQVLDASGLAWHWRSKGGAVREGAIVHLADTTGELRRLTQAADFAFIGKSLPPHGEGQSPIEAAALGVPSVMGPGMSNFRDIARGLAESGSSLRAGDEAEATVLLSKLATDPALRAEMSAKAVAWFQSQRGARKRTLDAIDALLA
jgi:3-deoxy-D-manno-octulosonic-acid transferase